VITLLALDRAGAQAVCMAPDAPQMHVINHLTGQESGETRNVLVESARIARGDIRNLAEVSGGDIDALIIPGGYGAARTCATSRSKVPGRSPSGVVRFIGEMLARKSRRRVVHRPGHPGRGGQKPRPGFTIGNDPGTAAALEAMGGRTRKPGGKSGRGRRPSGGDHPAYMLGRA
jgi:enhancing lycopene biosynthesis protein 2